MKPAAQGLGLKASGIFLMAAIIGLLGGLLGAGFQEGVRGLWSLLMGQGESIVAAAAGLTWLEALLLPAAGGLLAGLFLLLIHNKSGPFGIADIIGLVALRRGTIRLRESFAQILSSVCTIGTGGSIGREGATSQIAATVGAGLSHLFRTNSRTRAVLLGCGVSAGMACSYNAPIAGAIFVMEAVLGNFAMDVFAPVVVASVLSTMVRRWLIEPGPLYELQTQLELDWRLVLVALVLGAICGLGGIAFRRSLQLGKAAFSRLKLPLFLRMALGGLIVGAIGIQVPQVWGNGFEVIQEIVAPKGEVGTFLTLVFFIMLLKVVATACTAGSGGLGGVFTPNLVVGAALGAFFGSAVLLLAPGMGDNRIAFALVGMAGLCAATMHAPITAVVLVFELTGDYGLILPLMLCSIVASLFARMLDEDSYYSEHLRAQGQEIPTGLEELAIKSTYVRDIMRRDVVKLQETATFEEVLDVFTNSRRATVYVLDENDILLGHIHLHDVKNFINDPSLSSVVIAADLTRAVPTVTSEESLASILGRFDDPDLEELAVTTTGDPRPRLSGRITRRDLIACLSEEVLGRRKLRAKFRIAGRQEADFVQLPEGYALDRVTLPDDYQGRALDSLDLQAQAGLTILLVVHSLPDGTEQRLAAEPQVVMEPGTSLVVLGRPEAIEAFKNRA